MKKNIFLSAIVAGCISLTSCYGTRILVGDVSANEPVVKVQTTWNHHFICGLVPVAKTDLNTSEYVEGIDNYVVKTNVSFVNGLIAFITYGIYTPSQTTFFMPISELKRH